MYYRVYIPGKSCYPRARIRNIHFFIESPLLGNDVYRDHGFLVLEAWNNLGTTCHRSVYAFSALSMAPWLVTRAVFFDVLSWTLPPHFIFDPVRRAWLGGIDLLHGGIRVRRPRRNVLPGGLCDPLLTWCLVLATYRTNDQRCITLTFPAVLVYVVWSWVSSLVLYSQHAKNRPPLIVPSGVCVRRVVLLLFWRPYFLHRKSCRLLVPEVCREKTPVQV